MTNKRCTIMTAVVEEEGVTWVPITIMVVAHQVIMETTVIITISRIIATIIMDIREAVTVVVAAAVAAVATIEISSKRRIIDTTMAAVPMMDMELRTALRMLVIVDHPISKQQRLLPNIPLEVTILVVMFPLPQTMGTVRRHLNHPLPPMDTAVIHLHHHHPRMGIVVMVSLLVLPLLRLFVEWLNSSNSSNNTINSPNSISNTIHISSSLLSPLPLLTLLHPLLLTSLGEGMFQEVVVAAVPLPPAEASSLTEFRVQCIYLYHVYIILLLNQLFILRQGALACGCCYFVNLWPLFREWRLLLFLLLVGDAAWQYKCSGRHIFDENEMWNERESKQFPSFLYMEPVPKIDY